jgi:hypothetical protein
MSDVDEVIKILDKYKSILEAMKDPRYQAMVEKYKIQDVTMANMARIYLGLQKMNKDFFYLESAVRSVGVKPK